MRIGFTAIYPEVNIEFKISWKVFKLIMEKINALNLISNNKSKLKNREYIGFMISTKENCNDIITYKPKYYKNSKFINIDMDLPYLKETDENNYVKQFLDNLENGIIKGLKELEIEDKRIEKIFENIVNEVIGNENYKYTES
jgi:hypothetical protein